MPWVVDDRDVGAISWMTALATPTDSSVAGVRQERDHP
jgi:hypothetical protein